VQSTDVTLYDGPATTAGDLRHLAAQGRQRRHFEFADRPTLPA